MENDTSTIEGKPRDCSETVRKMVCVEAKVTIDPHVDVGPIRYYCRDRSCDEEDDGRCQSKPEERCSFVVRKFICVEIPLTFSAATHVDPLGIVCDIEDDCCAPDCHPTPAD